MSSISTHAFESRLSNATGLYQTLAGLRAQPPHTVWYLATPYSKFPAGRPEAYRWAVTITALLVANGFHVYSPIVHCHPLVGADSPGRLGTDATAWAAFNALMMDRCDGLLVAELDGWEDSEGVHQEIEYMRAARKAIVHLPAPDAL